MVKNNRMYVIPGLALLILLIVLNLFLPRASYHPPFTTYSPNPDGSKAIFLLLNITTRIVKESFKKLTKSL